MELKKIKKKQKTKKDSPNEQININGISFFQNKSTKIKSNEENKC